MSKKLSIIIIDDDPVIRDIFVQTISSTGHEILTAENGEKAIELAKQKPLDVAFVDMRMPGLDGLETFREIKKLRPEITTVMITGFADYEKIEAAIKEGAVDCMQKPFNISEIRAIITSKVRTGTGKVVKILVVDDETAIQYLFKKLQEIEGYLVKEALDAESALSYFRDGGVFDIAFIDIVLPGMDGIELCDRMNQMSPKTKVILFTGYPDKKERMKVKVGKGAVHALEKPFDIRTIREIVSAVEKDRER